MKKTEESLEFNISNEEWKKAIPKDMVDFVLKLKNLEQKNIFAEYCIQNKIVDESNTSDKLTLIVAAIKKSYKHQAYGILDAEQCLIKTLNNIATCENTKDLIANDSSEEAEIN